MKLFSFNTSRRTEYYVLPETNTTILEPENLCQDDNPIFLIIFVCSSAKNFEARQTIRETWGNETEFNYPYFKKFHAHYKGEYLDIDSNIWQNYTTLKGNSSQNVIDEQNIRVKVIFLLGQTDFQKKSITKILGDSTADGFTYEEEEVDELQLRINNESEVYGDIIQESFIDSYNNLTLKTVMMLKWVTNNCVDRGKSFLYETMQYAISNIYMIFLNTKDILFSFQ